MDNNQDIPKFKNQINDNIMKTMIKNCTKNCVLQDGSNISVSKLYTCNLKCSLKIHK